MTSAFEDTTPVVPENVPETWDVPENPMIPKKKIGMFAGFAGFASFVVPKNLLTKNPLNVPNVQVTKNPPPNVPNVQVTKKTNFFEENGDKTFTIIRKDDTKVCCSSLLCAFAVANHIGLNVKQHAVNDCRKLSEGFLSLMERLGITAEEIHDSSHWSKCDMCQDVLILSKMKNCQPCYQKIKAQKEMEYEKKKKTTKKTTKKTGKKNVVEREYVHTEKTVWACKRKGCTGKVYGKGYFCSQSCANYRDCVCCHKTYGGDPILPRKKPHFEQMDAPKCLRPGCPASLGENEVSNGVCRYCQQNHFCWECRENHSGIDVWPTPQEE